MKRQRSPKLSKIFVPHYRPQRFLSSTTTQRTITDRSPAPLAQSLFLETHRGKGFVVRRMFSDVEADVYVLVDGDATYDASSVRLMV